MAQHMGPGFDQVHLKPEWPAPFRFFIASSYCDNAIVVDFER